MENSSDNPVYATPRPRGESLENLANNPPVIQPSAGQPAAVSGGGFGAASAIQQNKTTYSTRWALVLSISAVAIFVLVGLTGYVVSQLHHTKPTASKSPDNYAVMNLPLGDLAKSGQLQLTQTSQLLINGQLSVNNTLVLEPTAQPAQAAAGELYYDQASNTLRYYNGHAYVSILNSANKTSFNNKTGNFTVGQGLALNGSQLVNTTTQTQQTPGVTSLQGETGAVSLTSGGGIQISGTTITNNGVTSLGGHDGKIGVGNGLSAVGGTLLNDGVINILSGSANLSVTHDYSGNYTITESGSGAGGTVSLGPNSPQADSSNNPSISIDKQGSGNLLQLATGVTPTNRFVVDQTGAILTGTIGFSQVTGQPNFVNTINGASGALTLGSGLSISGQQLLNAGVTSLSGTTNQVVVSSSTGNVTLSLPQSIAATSTPTFAGLNLSAPLTVTNGGTGASTASGARTNLGAAASGANSDITSLTGLTVINPSSTLTVGNDGQTLTLQGSDTTLSATSGSYTSTLGFAAPTADNSITIPNSSGTVCLSTGNCLGGGSGGANTSLSNLTSVAVNTSLLSGSSSINLGSAANPFDNLFLGGTATDNFEIGGTASATRTITLPDASGTVCLVELGNCAGSGGGLVGSGTAHTIAVFTGSNSVGNSILTQDSGATTVTVGGALSVTGAASAGSFNGLSLTANSTGFSIAGGTTSKTLTVTSDATIDQNLSTTSSPTFAGLTLSSALPVTSGGTGSSSAAGARANLGAAASGANGDITSLSGLTTPLSVGQGGTGANSLTQYGVLIGQGASAINAVAAGSSGMCLVSTSTAPTWQSCPGAGGVSSVNSQTGAITIAGVSAGSVSTAGGTITINDATASVKGLASFSGTDFTVSSGAVDTIQGISTGASPTFNGLTLTNALQPANGGTGINTSNPSDGQLLIGNGSGYSLNTLSAGSGINISDTSGSISISSPASGTCANCASQSLNNLSGVAINTGLLPGTTNSIDLGSGTELFRNEYLGGNLQGNTATFKTTTNSTTAFQIQNSSSSVLLNADTTNMQVDIGALTAPGTITAMLAPTAPTVTPTGTTGSTSYGYEVTVVSANGAETLTSTAGTTSTGNATLTSSNYNAISWSSVSGASLYKIYRTTGGTTQGLIGSTTSTSFSDTGYTAGAAAPALASSGSLTASTTYYYKVTALDDTGGETVASSEVSASTTSTYNTITLSWAPVAGARSYKVYRGTSSGAENTYYTTATNSFTDTGATGTSASPPTTATAYSNNLDNSANATITIGNSGTATGQLYIGGVVPSGPVGSTGIASNVDDFAMQGNYAYVSYNSASPALQIFDVSNPAAPTLTGSFHASSYTRGVVVSGQYVYLNVNDYLDIINIANPSDPVLVNSPLSTYLDDNSSGMTIAGKYLYVFSDNLLYTIDISNPTAPVIVSTIQESFSTSGNVCGSNCSAAQNGYLYVVDDSGFNILSLSNPAEPANIGGATTAHALTSLSLQGNYVYATSGSAPGLQTFNVSNPANPILVGSYGTHSLYSVTAQGRYAYAADTSGNGSVDIFDISNTAKPNLVGSTSSLPGSSSLNYLAVQGRYAYALGNNSLGVFDLGGEYTQSLQAGSTETGSLQVDDNEQVSGSSSITGGLNVGGSAQITGDTGITGSLTLTGALQGGNNLSTPGAPSIGTHGTAGSTSYSYEVVAVSSSGGTTPASAAGSTATGNATLTSSNYNAISWTAVTGASNYYIYRTASAGTPSSTGYIGSATGTSFNDTGIAGTTAAPTSDTSGTITENGATTINGQTTIKSVTNSTSAFRVQNASGSAILNVDSTNMRVGVDTTSSAMSTPSLSSASLQNSPGAPTITPTGTTGSAHYSYEVTAVTSQGLESVPSSAGSTTTGNATLSGTNYNAISWSSVTGASKYNIYRKAITNGSPSTLGFIGTATSTSFNDTGLSASGAVPTTTGLTNGTTYYYELTAIDSAGGQTTVSTEASTTTTASGQGIVLHWNPVTGAVGYRLYRGTSSGGETGYYAITGIQSGSSIYFIDNGATLNNTSATLPSSNTAYVSTNTSNSNLQVSVGGNGTPTGQLYVSGTLPSGAVGSVSISSPYSMLVQGKYAYTVSASASDLEVYDLSNPASPHLVGSVSTGDTTEPTNLSVAGNYAYVTTTYPPSIAYVEIFNITNPAAPTLVSSIPLGGYNSLVQTAAQGKYLYIANIYTKLLEVYDVSNASSPALVGTAPISNGVSSLVVSGNYVYGLDSNTNQILIFDVSNPLAPHQISSTSTLGGAQNLTLSSHYLFVDTNSSLETQIFDISNPYNPINLSNTSIRGTGYPAPSIAVSDRYAYVLNSISGIQVMDISNISNPVLLGTIPTASSPIAIAVSGRYAYVANNSSNTIQVFDLGGAYIQQLETGSAEISDLQVDNSEQIDGNSAVQGNLNVGGSAQISGSVGIGGNLSLSGALQGGNNLSTPGPPIITLSGTPGGISYSYEVVAVNSGGGTTPASAAGSTTTGNATLNATNYNIVSWTAVTGASQYYIYRTATGGTPSSTGYIGSTASTSFNDTGIAGTTAAPTTDTSGTLTLNGAATINGSDLIKSVTNSTTAFQVQTAGGTSILTVDTSGSTVTVAGALTVTTLTVNSTSVFTGNVTISGEINANNNVRGINVSVTASATTQTITFGTSYPDANYSVLCTPNWNTTCYVTSKANTGFTLNFGTAAPSSPAATVDWLVIH